MFRFLRLVPFLTVLAVAGAIPADTIGGSAGLQRGLSQARYDQLAGQSDVVDAEEFWRGRIKSEAEMVPPLSVRFDDWGSRPEIAAQAIQWIRRGLKVSIACNVFGTDSTDSLALIPLIAALDQYGHDKIEWIQHMNGNAIISRYGYSSVTTSAQNSGYFTSYFQFTRANWVNEMRKNAIVVHVNNVAAGQGSPYRISESEITTAVWPGDNSFALRKYANAVPDLMQSVMDELGFNIIIASVGSDSTTYNALATNGVGVAPATNTQLYPFMHYNKASNRHLFEMSSTFDLGISLVERGATGGAGSPAWTPDATQGGGTSRFTLAQKTNFFADGDASTTLNVATESTVQNMIKTFRWYYTQAAAARGGLNLVMHSQATSNNASTTYNLSYPASGTPNSSLNAGDSVNGGAGTFNNPVDFNYMAAACSVMVARGYFRSTTVGEHARWLAYGPGKTGLIVGGWEDPIEIWREIGDTIGVKMPPYFRGGGTPGAAANTPLTNASSLATTNNWNDQGLEGDPVAFDGQITGYGTATTWPSSESTARYYCADGRGPKMTTLNRALMLYDKAGLNANLYFTCAVLPPGQYTFSAYVQSAEYVLFPTQPQLWVSGYGQFQRTALSFGGTAKSIVSYMDRLMVASGATTHLLQVPSAVANYQTTGTTDFGDDAWPGAEPTSRSTKGWYRIHFPFVVPREIAAPGVAYVPLTNGQHGTISYIQGEFQIHIRFLAEDYSGGASTTEEHPRVGPVLVRWVGDI